MHKKLLATLVLSICASTGAQASPFTYEFETSWTNGNDPAGYYGTGATLDITVDNGGTSALYQTWNWADITQLKVTTLNNNVSMTTNPSSWYNHTFDSSSPSFITSDSTGNNAQVAFNGYSFITQYEFNRFELSSWGNSNNIGLYQDQTMEMMMSGTDAPSAFTSFPDGTQFSAVNINSVAAVPVPAAVWLFLSGLIGVLGLNRRNKIS